MKKILLLLPILIISNFIRSQFDIALVNGTGTTNFVNSNCRINVSNRTFYEDGNPSGEPITIKFYLSTDLTLDPSDVEFWERNDVVGSVTPGSYANVSIANISGCRVVPMGTYYYIAEYSSDNGLDTNLTNNIYVHPTPITINQECNPQILNGTDTSFCNNDTLILQGNLPINNQTWFKNFGTGTISLNGGGTAYELTSTASNQIGVSFYQVIGCTAGQVFLSLDSNSLECAQSTDLKEIDLSKLISIYPNPTHSEDFTMQNTSETDVAFSILDNQGKLVKASFIKAKQNNIISIDIKGVYTIIYHNSFSSSAKKIIVN